MLQLVEALREDRRIARAGRGDRGLVAANMTGWAVTGTCGALRFTPRISRSGIRRADRRSDVAAQDRASGCLVATLPASDISNTTLQPTPVGHVLQVRTSLAGVAELGRWTLRAGV